MLDLVAVDDAAGRSGLGLKRRERRARDGDGQLCIAEFHLHINGVGLLGDQAHGLQGPRFEALRLGGEVEMIGGQCIEVVDAACIRGGGDDVIGIGIGQGEFGSWDDRSGGIGYGALD